MAANARCYARALEHVRREEWGVGRGAFGMLEVTAIPPKPRERFVIDVPEVGIPLRATEDLLEVAAPHIDHASITDAAPVDVRSGGR